MTIILPLDVIEKVIETLARDDEDLSSTKACSLASHDFLSISRKHIFNHISVNDPTYFRPRGISLSMLQRKLIKFPHLSVYILNLKYIIDAGEVIDPSVIDGFKHITHLRSLTVSKRILMGMPFGFSYEWNEIRPFLFRLLTLPTLKELALVGVEGFDMTDLIHCTALEKFDIKYSSLAAPPSTPPRSSLTLRKITVGTKGAMEISRMVGVLRADGNSFINFSRIYDLQLHIFSVEDYDATKKLLGACDQLQSLSIAVNVLNTTDDKAPNYALRLIGLPNFPFLDTLRRLVFYIPINDDFDGLDPYGGSLDVLAKMANKNVMEELTFNLSVVRDVTFTEKVRWERLEEVLVSPGWQYLKRISLDIEVCYNQSGKSAPLVNELQGVTEGRFSRLKSSYSLAFELSVHGPVYQ